MRRSVFARTVVLTAGVAGLWACTSATPSDTSDTLNQDPEAAAVSADRGDTFALKAGQVARVGNAGVLVGFRGVAADSRCPSDVTCVWQGDAELRIHATIGRLAWTPFALHTALEPRSARFEGYTITIVNLEPVPKEGQQIPGANYVVTIRIE
jgi:hypothetical protein